MRIVVQLPITLLALNVGVWFAPGKEAAERQAPQGYIVSLPAETAADRRARHKEIAQRRRGPVIIVHRGASALAPENTLQAYAAAMDYGADGCEIDIRRTADGILVLFHDDGLDRMTDALGPLSQYAYRELAALSFRSRYKARPGTGIPTLAAVFELARNRAMLLHLDIKEPGLEADIRRLLDVADIWDHIVEINQYNSVELRRNPNYQPLPYKAPGLQEARLDLDPDKVREALAKPGKLIMVDDPRVAAHELNRAIRRVPLPQDSAQHCLSPASSSDRIRTRSRPHAFCECYPFASIRTGRRN